jgi:exodeoxyribonuclease VII small subunit
MAASTKRPNGDAGAAAPGPDGSAPGVPVAELAYADASQELDDIVAELEEGLVDVDVLVERLQRATDIVDELDRRLRGTRLRVEELVPRLESIGQEADDELGEEGLDGSVEGTAPGLF